MRLSLLMENNNEQNLSGAAAKEDYLIRATAADDAIRAFAVTTRGVTEEARQRHGLSPVASAALGRTMAAALMMGADLKNDTDVLTIRFTGDGPIGTITVTADAKGGVKGYVDHPDVILPPNAQGKFDVGTAVGHGELHIMKDLGLKEPYAGTVAIQTGEIAEDISYYFAVSEQVPSVVSLGVLCNTADYSIRESGGFMLQLLPFCPDEVIEKLEERCRSLPSATDMLRQGMSPEEILSFVLEGMDPVVRDKKPVRFRCDCSRERVEKAIIAMGAKEIRSLIADGKPVTLNCGFCNTDYTFSIDDLITLLDRAQRTPS